MKSALPPCLVIRINAGGIDVVGQAVELGIVHEWCVAILYLVLLRFGSHAGDVASGGRPAKSRKRDSTLLPLRNGVVGGVLLLAFPEKVLPQARS